VKVSPLPAEPLNVVLSSGTAEKPTSTDAFGRLRFSDPFTLFDSSHRYRDNGLWNTDTASGGSSAFNANEGLVDLSVTTTSGSRVYRETQKVFSYQPGKSLLIISTFVMAPAKTGLRQRVGYFGTANGIYIELNDTTLSFVERSSVSGSVSETRVNQADWNIDKLDGTGPSGLTLDITKAQIFWSDIEWLGLGTVRVGFIINGKLIHCHSFNHANLITTTYISTASLPLRYEIENTGTTSSSSNLKQVCSTVISEGGYELRGAQLSALVPVTSPVALATAGTYYPLISVRLKTSPNRLDAIVILSAISVLGTSSNTVYNWLLIRGGTTSGGTWVSAGINSAVEYKIDGGGITGGDVVASGYLNSTNQSAPTVNILKEAIFSYQLERNTFTSTPTELTLAITASTNSSIAFGSMDFEEVSR
ncbi:MAG: hypothetical protein ACO3I1_06780, partial [Burkholderiales bacterium]